VAGARSRSPAVVAGRRNAILKLEASWLGRHRTYRGRRLANGSIGNIEAFWQSLRRRKVVQWGLAYVAGAWAFLQGLGYAGATFHWPDQVQQLSTLALLAGLPVVLVLAWFHGDRGEQRAGATEITIIALLLLGGGALLWLYDPVDDAPAPAAVTASSPATSAAVSDARPSIAVLPFENRSRLEEHAFFVDGIHDDILTQLSKVSALRVISRTSVERFRKTDLSVQQIAEQLGVKSVLEGGVQRAGNRVRINVQLIDATTDAHSWAEVYDRELTVANMFAIQSEVAAAIAGALKTALTPAEQAWVKQVPTQSLEAWEAYQLGRQRLAKRTAGALAEAERFFQIAIDRDRTFALAYAGLADAIWLKADYSGQPVEPAVAKAQQVLDQALQLDPNLAEAHATLAKFAQERRELELAELEYRRAIDLNPNYPTAHQWYAQLLGLQGRDAEAMQSTRKALELDPLSVHLQVNLASGLSGLGHFDEALAGFSKARSIDPLSPLPYSGIGAVLATGFGQLDDAIPFVEKAIELDTSGSWYKKELARIYLDLQDDNRAEQWLDRAADGGKADAVRAYLYLYRGKQAKALAYARNALTIDGRDWEALVLLRNADLEARDFNAARSSYARAFPELLADQGPTVDPLNYIAAIDLSLVLQGTGERARAAQLLDRSQTLIRTWPRLGPWGYRISDVQIDSLRGEKGQALAKLREAEAAGWRGPTWRYFRDFDPNLATIRNEPEFRAVFADIERDMAEQRARLAARPKDAPLELTDASR
jgi:TolB-like protein/Tfp pilus assembly protein PilF